MKKRMISVLVTAVVGMGMLAGCGSSQDIGRDAALDVALKDAGVSGSDTTRLLVSEEKDDGRKMYEISFDVAEKEYDYDIQASDGKILSSEVDINKSYVAPENSGAQSGTDTSTQGNSSGNTGETDASAQGNSSGNTSGTQNSGVTTEISVEQATQIALERVPGAGQQDIRIELDYDDGRYKYEGEIIYNNTEYDFEIDANSGTILEWSEERA